VYLNEREIPKTYLRSLPDSTLVVALRSLKDWGVKVGWNGSSNLVTVTVADKNVAYSGDGITILDGVTFADSPNSLYTPVHALGQALNSRASDRQEESGSHLEQ